MTAAQPAYFEPIRRKAADRWAQLEQDPELAGPWHQLFKQVQSPRHIVSELLQNADDAGATEASVQLAGGAFVFEHNGQDFVAEHFASLCAFGYSNKRSLHTIGFRGIGFKSTFSLGDSVELFTPSLAVQFFRQRFTEPHWVGTSLATGGLTRIRVAIKDGQRKSEVERNLDEWVNSPVSLLFFKHIRLIRIGDRTLQWTNRGPGPISGSEWMALNDTATPFLVVRSGLEEFPEDALAEIRDERLLGANDDVEFPPCKVELVLGVPGRLYVVLPTGVQTPLPFACNAPFLQDPARIRIKDPETSPTNRWLLERVGRLAADAMLGWLNTDSITTVRRANAYELLPNVDRESATMEGVCAAIAEEAFDQCIDGKPLLLTEDAQLVEADACTALPPALFDVWPATLAAALFDEKKRPTLSKDVTQRDRQKLVDWGLVDEIDRQAILDTLCKSHPPRPPTWRNLLNLWIYVAPEIVNYRYDLNSAELRIVPVQGRDELYASGEVVRLGERKLLQSDEDWEFLAARLLVLNQNWPRFLSEERRLATEKGSTGRETIERAFSVLSRLGLSETSDTSKVINQVAADFFSKKDIKLRECVRLTQIAAKLGTGAGDAFRFATRDKHLRAVSTHVLVDPDGTLEELLPESQRETRVLHGDYTADFQSCSREEWDKWIVSGRAGLRTFVPLVERRTAIYGRRQLEQEARRRGCADAIFYPYVTDHFVVDDWDFDATSWRHWLTAAASDPAVWTKVAERILAEGESFWSDARSASLIQIATTGSEKMVTYASPLPSWILRLQDLPCLRDTRGFPRKPAELLRRTPETEALLDVEPFVHATLDREAVRDLLDLLGVRSEPTGPDRILDCLRALSHADSPPVAEVEKWYRRLDQLAEQCSTADLQLIRSAFRTDRIIYTRQNAWATSAAVFLSANEEDVPGAALIRESVSDLTLWGKIGIAERPTAELALNWLKSLPMGSVLDADALRRVRALLVRYPIRIWEACGHWLNLANEWCPVGKLDYSISMQSLTPWAHLHPWVKQTTADLQRLPSEVIGNPPFSSCHPLAQQVEERLREDLFGGGPEEIKAWLCMIGEMLCRVRLESEDETARVRGLAQRLAHTAWRERSGLEVVPYIGGRPAGTPRKTDVLWLDQTLFVDRMPKAKLARRVPDEIAKAFGKPDIKAALDYAFERAPEDVRDYIEANFSLEEAEPREATAPNTRADDQGTPTHDGNVTSEPEEQTSRPVEAEPSEDSQSEEPDATEEQELPEMPETHSPEPRPKPQPRPEQPSLIEMYAKATGFRKDGTDRFIHASGQCIIRAPESPFPWERRSATGQLLRCYLPLAWRAESETAELKAEVWHLLEEQADTHALIAKNLDDTPIELTGSALVKLRQEGKVVLYPASYRLVHAQSN